MRCPNCGSLQSTCFDSRPSENHTTRTRKHRCQDCGDVWPTIELSETDLLARLHKARAPFMSDRKRLAALIEELDQLKAKYKKMLL